MKVTLHVPVEQYGFVSADVETPGSARDYEIVAGIYRNLSEAFKPKPINELPDKEWRPCLEQYLMGQGMSEECMHRLSPKQSWLIHELDKAFNRIKSKET